MGALHEDLFTFLIIFRSVLLRIRNVSDRSWGKHQNTHFVFSDFLENRAFYEVMLTVQYSACALRVGWIRLQTHTQNMNYLLFFHGNNGCTNATQCYVIRTLPVWLSNLLKVLCHKNVLFLRKIHTAFLHFTVIFKSNSWPLKLFIFFFALILHHFNLNTFPEFNLVCTVHHVSVCR